MVRAKPVRVHAEQLNGDIFAITSEPTEKHALWGELFKEKERNFLRKHLRAETVSFSIGATCQIALRAVWQPGARPDLNRAGDEPLVPKKLADRQNGRFILLLHALSGQVTNSWAWAKFMRPLYELGFSVVAIDLPGFGRSGVGQNLNVSFDQWLPHDWHIIFKVMEILGMARVNLAACGESCCTVLRMLQQEPNLLQKDHFFFNPVLDYDVLFPQRRLPGGGDQREAFKQAQQAAFAFLVRSTGKRIWACFDRAETLAAPLAINLQMFLGASERAMTGDTIHAHTITDNHMCEAQAGAGVPVRILFPSSYLTTAFCEFIANGRVPTALPELQTEARPLTGDNEAKAAMAVERARRQRGKAINMDGWNKTAISEALSLLRAVPDASQAGMAQFAVSQITRGVASAKTLVPEASPTALAASARPGLPALPSQNSVVAKEDRETCRASSIATSLDIVMQTRPKDPVLTRQRLLSNLGKLRRSVAQANLLMQPEQQLVDQTLNPDEQQLVSRTMEESLRTYMEEQERLTGQKMAIAERTAERRAGLRHMKSVWEVKATGST